MSLYLCTYLHIFSVDRSEHMIKPGAKFFFHFVYTQDEKTKVHRDFRICFHYLRNQNVSIALKKSISAISANNHA